jgi:hypothetical protein
MHAAVRRAWERTPPDEAVHEHFCYIEGAKETLERCVQQRSERGRKTAKQNKQQFNTTGQTDQKKGNWNKGAQAERSRIKDATAKQAAARQHGKAALGNTRPKEPDQNVRGGLWRGTDLQRQ